ncbi:hypothetical protein Tco_0312624 [Tanacetum coccineum]
MSRTKKNGSIVNATAAKVIKELLNDASTSTSNTTNDASTSTSNTTTGNLIVDWSNDDLASVKGKEKGDYTLCIGPNIRLPRSKRSCVSQVPMLKSKINELEVELKDLKERQHIEMKEMKENQAAILQFMAKYKNHNSNEDFPNVLNTTNTNTKVANDSSSVHNPGPYGNSTSTRASENKKSDKAVTSPEASKRISAEMQLRKKFLEEDMQVKQRVVNCRQTLKTLKREDVQLLRKFGIQFKGDPEQVRLQLLGVPFKSSKRETKKIRQDIFKKRHRAKALEGQYCRYVLVLFVMYLFVGCFPQPDSADALDSKPKHEDQRRSNKIDNGR